MRGLWRFTKTLPALALVGSVLLLQKLHLWPKGDIWYKCQ